MMLDVLIQKTSQFRVTSPDGRQWPVIAYGNVSKDAVFEWARKTITSEMQPPPDGFRLEYNQPPPRMGPILVILLPPALLLVLGLAGYWVASGFRKDTAPS
jgi:hypothetical protein